MTWFSDQLRREKRCHCRHGPVVLAVVLGAADQQLPLDLVDGERVEVAQLQQLMLPTGPGRRLTFTGLESRNCIFESPHQGSAAAQS